MIGWFHLKQCLWSFYRSKSGTKWQRINLHFHSDHKRKSRSACVQQMGGNMLMFFLTSTWNGLGFVLKKRLVLMIQSRLFFWERQYIYTRCTFRFKTLQDVFIHLELCYTLHERSFSKIHNRDTYYYNNNYSNLQCRSWFQSEIKYTQYVILLHK